jgi:peptidoglycan/xylan/chitin deacetylase (PgdA/CDA1 family)
LAEQRPGWSRRSPGMFKRAIGKAVIAAAGPLGLNRMFRHLNRRVPLAVMYHGVTDRQRMDLGFSRHVTTAEFDAQLARLKEHFTVVSVREWVEAVRRPTPAAGRLATITFDDAYENASQVAAPILESHGMTACFYVTTGPVLEGTRQDQDLLELAILYGQCEDLTADLNGREISLRLGDASERLRLYAKLARAVQSVSWKERIAFSTHVYRSANCPEPPEKYRGQYAIMTAEHVAELVRRGMEVGSHTVHHVMLAECSDEEIAEELTRAAGHLETMTGIPVGEQTLAYPRGSRDERAMRIAREVGHPAAFAVGSGVQPDRDHLYELPRIGIYRGESPGRFAALTSGFLEKLKSLRWRGA